MCENSHEYLLKNGQVQTLGLIISSPCWNPVVSDKPVVTTSIEWYMGVDGMGVRWGEGEREGEREGVLFLVFWTHYSVGAGVYVGGSFYPNSKVSKQKHVLTIVRSYSPFQLTKVPFHCLCYPHKSLVMTVR